MTFADWYSKLTEDPLWYELLRAYKDETIRKAGEKVYAQLVAEGTVIYRPMSENRKHVYNIVCKNPGDKVKKDWYKIEEQKKEAEKAKEWVPLKGEARQAKLKEWMDSVSKVEMVSAVPKLTVKEIIEQGDWRAVATIAPRSEVEKHIIVETHIEKVNTARRKMFLSAFPDASEEEITAYLKKFDQI